jgi:hypothetical protein
MNTADVHETSISWRYMIFSFGTRLLGGGDMKFNWHMTIMFDSEEYWAIWASKV